MSILFYSTFFKMLKPFFEDFVVCSAFWQIQSKGSCQRSEKVWTSLFFNNYSQSLQILSSFPSFPSFFVAVCLSFQFVGRERVGGVRDCSFGQFVSWDSRGGAFADPFTRQTLRRLWVTNNPQRSGQPQEIWVSECGDDWLRPNSINQTISIHPSSLQLRATFALLLYRQPLHHLVPTINEMVQKKQDRTFQTI